MARNVASSGLERSSRLVAVTSCPMASLTVTELPVSPAEPCFGESSRLVRSQRMTLGQIDSARLAMSASPSSDGTPYALIGGAAVVQHDHLGRRTIRGIGPKFFSSSGRGTVSPVLRPISCSCSMRFEPR